MITKMPNADLRITFLTHKDIPLHALPTELVRYFEGHQLEQPQHRQLQNVPHSEAYQVMEQLESIFQDYRIPYVLHLNSKAHDYIASCGAYKATTDTSAEFIAEVHTCYRQNRRNQCILTEHRQLLADEYAYQSNAMYNFILSKYITR